MLTCSKYLIFSIPELVAQVIERCLEITLMKPKVGGILGAFLDGKSFVLCSAVICIGIAHVNIGPQDSLSFLGGNLQIQAGKGSLATRVLIEVVQVDKDGQDPDALRPFKITRDVVGVCFV